ncbi:methyltransferase type 11 [Streptomyces davaonensis JCM 4913]|uniref:Arsenite methyltransferase n=1 Tax=Streptomyces davaonensis (strain DSM 101723 / JCM 4913 / KCC S-0913 / 768) TaxID=1214101 RepID=K4QX81_STRDJ|nr:methyltransferase domain-containing protein [Streptomyces davaonensis]CCK28681.1 methyltransferase type 11 [Streptomyces davaonensis JCM 4913]
MTEPQTRVLDTRELETKVKDLYGQVAAAPGGDFHFELGRPLAVRLGYPAAVLDRIPAEAVESFAGVGHALDLAALQPGERVLDLGSGSGTDVFCAALAVGPTGRVIGVDFTPAQIDKARRLSAAGGFDRVELREGRIEDLPVANADIDCVISNGVINLSPDKQRVFAEAARVLRPGGRLAIADLVTERPLSDAITAQADLWASCIAGAAQEDTYRHLIEIAGLRVLRSRPNPYGFLSERARNASARYGVKSISLLAVKPRTPGGA